MCRELILDEEGRRCRFSGHDCLIIPSIESRYSYPYVSYRGRGNDGWVGYSDAICASHAEEQRNVNVHLTYKLRIELSNRETRAQSIDMRLVRHVVGWGQETEGSAERKGGVI